MLWHVKEAVLGHTPLLSAPLLFYPSGISLLAHALGPFMGFLALPFWAWGAVAAYNGAMLSGFVLTGLGMYALARGLGFRRVVSLFAGALLLAVPMHVAGLHGHLDKTFLGLMPLVLLCGVRALQPARSAWWVVLLATALLLVLLHNGLQFIQSAMSLALLACVAWSQAVRKEPVLQRAVLSAVASLVAVVPLLFAILVAVRNPLIRVDMNTASIYYQPDVLELLLPTSFTRLGMLTWPILDSYRIQPSIETAISFSWTGLILCAVAALAPGRAVVPWLLLTVAWAVLALGPSLHLFGRGLFTEYRLPLMMPYALFTALPGLGFLRTPGRLILMAQVGFAVCASFGLSWLIRRFGRLASVGAGLAIVLVLAEGSPSPWARHRLGPVPSFYEALAADRDVYGIFDLPVRPPGAVSYLDYSSRYQIDQMIHRKGIATGYIGRSYSRHPVFPCLLPEPQPDVLVNGEPSVCYANTLFDLAARDYRYVVWHKPQQDDEYRPDPAQADATSAFVLGLFAGRTPAVDDEMITAYRIPRSPASGAMTTTLGLGANWYPAEHIRRWMKSPATLFISAPQAEEASLQITPDLIFDPSPAHPVGHRGILRVELDGSTIGEFPIETGNPAAIPLSLKSGVHTLTLHLKAGSFRPSDYGIHDNRELSFAIRAIDLVVKD